MVPAGSGMQTFFVRKCDLTHFHAGFLTAL
jgi:hypothetical protein